MLRGIFPLVVVLGAARVSPQPEQSVIDVVDLTHPTTVRMIAEYYGAVNKRWKICINCGVPGLGTTMHLEHEGAASQAVYPALIPTEYLLTRLVLVDVSALVSLQPALVLSREVALQWTALRHDPPEPTLLLFRFGWRPETDPPANHRACVCKIPVVLVDVSALVSLQPALVLSREVALQWTALRHDPPEPTLLLFRFGWRPETDPPANHRACVCKIPGVSFDLAEWIAANLTRVVGVATDAPTLESQQTRELNARTVAGILGRSGVYMMENVHIRRQLPERGCMAIAMPLKLQHSNYVPSRLTAFCPGAGGAGGAGGAARQVVLSLRSAAGAGAGAGAGDAHAHSHAVRLYPSRSTDVDLDDILS